MVMKRCLDLTRSVTLLVYSKLMYNIYIYATCKRPLALRDAILTTVLHSFPIVLLLTCCYIHPVSLLLYRVLTEIMMLMVQMVSMSTKGRVTNRQTRTVLMATLQGRLYMRAPQAGQWKFLLGNQPSHSFSA